ncbi:hypothetical protein BT96DRAFT_1024038 [Gymnopus androsaceus JB14]|uniref:CHAT domain-containing protein n=1 Tax=Gymnopus androsaceus JB14 TaxID=1447944 RepID=A0A6A4H1A7_9AGAR|nr:hypothetical protein BT96DRAFT_1024038 [Gymnopus androsaceus JB14]
MPASLCDSSESVVKAMDNRNNFDSLLQEAEKFLELYKESNSVDDLNNAITSYQMVLDVRPDDPEVQESLGLALASLFIETSLRDDIEHSISCHTRSFELYPPESHDRRCALFYLGNRYVSLYEQFQDLTDLETAILHFERAKEGLSLSKEHPGLNDVLANLGGAVEHRYDALHDPADLDCAVDLCRQALQCCPVDNVDLWRDITNLASILTGRVMDKGMATDEPGVIADINEAILLGHQAMELRSPGDLEHAESLAGISILLYGRYQHTSIAGDLDEAIDMGQSALTQDVLSGLLRLRCALYLGKALYLRFESLQGRSDLDNAVCYSREALTLCTSDHMFHRQSLLCQLAVCLLTRYHLNHDMVDLDEAIDCYSSNLELELSGCEDHSEAVFQLENAVQKRYDRLKDVRDLDTLIKCNRLALDFIPREKCGKYLQRLEAISDDIWERYQQLGQAPDLEKVIAYREEALHACSPGDNDYYIFLHNLGTVLRARFIHLGQVEDITRSIALQREALSLCPSGSPHQLDISSLLMSALATSFLQQGKSVAESDLDEANKLAKTIQIMLTETAGNYTVLHSLAILARINFNNGGSMSDLNEAIHLGERVWDLPVNSYGKREQSDNMNGLGSALHRRFQLEWDFEDLKRAISYFRMVVQLLPSDHGNYPETIINLMSSLTSRFEAKWEINDIDEAVQLGRHLLGLPQLEAHPALQHNQRFSILHTFANALIVRHDHLKRMADIEEALSYHYEAKELHLSQGELWHCLIGIAQAHYYLGSQQTSLEHLDNSIRFYMEALALSHVADREGHIRVLISLGACHLTRFEKCFQLAGNTDVDKSIEYSETAIEMIKQYKHSHFFESLTVATNNYLAAQYRRLETSHSKDLKEIDSVVASYQKLINSAPFQDNFFQRTLLYNLGRVIYCRFEASDQKHDLDEACSSFRAALEKEGVDIKNKVDIAQMWAFKAHEKKHHSALEAYSWGLAALQQYLDLCPSLPYRRTSLELYNARSLAVDAVSCTIEQGQSLESAVERLEQGRNILWSTLYRYRTPVPYKLANADPQLARQFEEARNGLERLAILLDAPDNASTLQELASRNMYHEVRWTQQRRLLKDWDVVLEKIRQINEFRDFLRSPSFPQMQENMIDGPVIFLNTSKHRCDAIIVTSHGHPTLVTLTSDLHKLAPDMAHVLTQLVRGERLKTLQSASGRDEITDILSELWYSIGKPVSDMLLHIGIQQGSRIWWCPTGALTFLPIHAAGVYTPKGPRTSILDIFVSSYTSSMSALATSRKELESRSPRDMHLLAVGQSKDLPKVLEEFSAMQDIVSSQMHLLDNNDAEPSLVVRDLREKYSWVHFSCHGDLNTNDPFLSSFRLSGKEPALKVIDLLEAQLPSAELAFLASCNSAAAESSSAVEEVITLASALQYCGFSSIMGTLWTMADEDAPALSRDFYTYMLRNGPNGVDVKESARALHEAVQEMRKRGVPAERWSTFIHIGV